MGAAPAVCVSPSSRGLSAIGELDAGLVSTACGRIIEYPITGNCRNCLVGAFAPSLCMAPDRLSTPISCKGRELD